jgi:hypothetical protein
LLRDKDKLIRLSQKQNFRRAEALFRTFPFLYACSFDRLLFVRLLGLQQKKTAVLRNRAKSLSDVSVSASQAGTDSQAASKDGVCASEAAVASTGPGIGVLFLSWYFLLYFVAGHR